MSEHDNQTTDQSPQHAPVTVPVESPDTKPPAPTQPSPASAEQQTTAPDLPQPDFAIDTKPKAQVQVQAEPAALAEAETEVQPELEAMPDPRAEALARLARLFGVMPYYLDGEQEIFATQLGLCRTLQTIAGDAINFDPAQASEDGLRTAIEAREAELAKQIFETAPVSWDDEHPAICAQLGSYGGTVRLKITTEVGLDLSFTAQAAECKYRDARTMFGYRRREVVMPLPADLADQLNTGIHTLEITWGKEGDAKHPQQTITTPYYRAPRRAYQMPPVKDAGQLTDARRWGLFAPVHAVRTASDDNTTPDTGIGDLRSLGKLAQWAFSKGAGLISTLPLGALQLGRPSSDDPVDPSPYAPVSRFFGCELYVDAAQTDEFPNCNSAQEIAASEEYVARAAELAELEYVDYAAQRDLRRPVLDALAAYFFTDNGPGKGQNAPDFKAFLKDHPDAPRYAWFRACQEDETRGDPQEHSPQADADQFATDHPAYRTHLYAQYAFWQQLRAFANLCNQHNALIYLDMPVGVRPGGYDAWVSQHELIHELEAGAPPDAMFAHGQLWGFPPAKPTDAPAQLHKAVTHLMRTADILRLDHVMALHRLYVTPKGLTAQDGVYLRYPAEVMYAMLTIESHKNKCALIGENLGMVPQEVNDTLANHALGGMYVATIFTSGKPGSALPTIKNNTIASLNTHDLPTFSAWWNGDDIEQLIQLELLSQKQAAAKDKERAKHTEALGRFLSKHKVFDPEAGVETLDFMRAVTRLLARTSAQVLLVNTEDIWGETRRQNMPGTSTQYPNWRPRWAAALEELAGDEWANEFLDDVHQLRNGPVTQIPEPQEPPRKGENKKPERPRSDTQKFDRKKFDDRKQGPGKGKPKRGQHDDARDEEQEPIRGNPASPKPGQQKSRYMKKRRPKPRPDKGHPDFQG